MLCRCADYITVSDGVAIIYTLCGFCENNIYNNSTLLVNVNIKYNYVSIRNPIQVCCTLYLFSLCWLFPPTSMFWLLPLSIAPVMFQ